MEVKSERIPEPSFAPFAVKASYRKGRQETRKERKGKTPGVALTDRL